MRDSNDDLNVQLLSRCMEEGRRLLKYNGAISLADEIDHLTKEEVRQISSLRNYGYIIIFI